MTRDRAISLLRRYRGGLPSPPRYYCPDAFMMRAVGERAYTRYLVEELIRRIKAAPACESPLSTVGSFCREIDDVMVRSDNPITIRFTETVYRIASDLSEYLWADEDRQVSGMGDRVYRLLTRGGAT